MHNLPLHQFYIYSLEKCGFLPVSPTRKMGNISNSGLGSGECASDMFEVELSFLVFENCCMLLEIGKPSRLRASGSDLGL